MTSRIVTQHTLRPRGKILPAGDVRKGGLLGAILSLASCDALAQRSTFTGMSEHVQTLHDVGLWVCVVISIIVFGAMFHTIFTHRRSKQPSSATIHEDPKVEVVWTMIPTLILVGMAVPATMALRDIDDTRDADLTVLITGSRWTWHYEYLEEGIGFFSRPDTPVEDVGHLLGGGESRPPKVDKPLVVPANRTIRFITSSNDGKHSWWVPDLAVRQAAVPGVMSETWMRFARPGVYRGQCTELCGMSHARMPIVVDVRPQAEFLTWLESQR